MSTVPPEAGLLGRISALTLRQRVHIAIVALLTAAAIGHQAVLWQWFIEDAAISFAYAKHLAEGHGFVSFVGGERVEGFSNPLWTFCLVVLHKVGFDLFEVVKWVQVLQAMVTVPVSYLIGREAFHDRPDNDAVLLVPAFVAANAQFAIWGSAGLENGQLHMLMALAIWRLLVEARKGGVPWSAVLWLLVSISRPESITYAAVGGFLSMLFHLKEGRGLRPSLWWLLMFWPPFLAYHAVRYQYFAWPFPNTFYAKVDHRDGVVDPSWGKRPWRWSQSWAHELGHGYFMPVYLFGLLGHGKAWRPVVVSLSVLFVGGSIQLAAGQRWLLPVILGSVFMLFAVGLTWNGQKAPRALIGGALIGIIALFGVSELARAEWAFVPNLVPSPEWVRRSPPALLIGGGLLLPLLSVGTPGWRARLTCWAMCMATTFFAVWAEFDWMKGYRWYASAAVPGAVLLAMGVDSMLHVLATWLRAHHSRFALGMGYGWGLIVLAGFATIHGFHTKAIEEKPDPRPQAIRARVNFVESVRSDLFVDDEPWIDLDVDMGGHLYWSDFTMLDIAGLIDVPMGHHKFERAFIQEYLFQEHRPHFAHVHGSWATTSRIPTHPEWKRDYVEIPGFPAGANQLHIGNYVRKDLMLVDRSPFPAEQRRSTARGVVFEGFSVPVDPAKARAMYLEIGVRKTRDFTAGDFRMLMVLKGPGGFDTFDLPMAYDWWKPTEWTQDRVFHGKYGVPLPPHLKEGTYDIAFVLLDGDGAVMPMPSTDEREPLLARGEVRFDGAVTIVSPEARAERAAKDREQAIEAANDGRCAEADDLWWQSRRSRPLDKAWLEEFKPVVNHARASCAIRAAEATDDVQEKVELIERARYLEPLHPELWPLAHEVSAPLLAEGRAALQAGQAACAEVGPSAHGMFAEFFATDEDNRALVDCFEEQKPAWTEAYRQLSLALRADPMLSWGRRWAEEARALRLGIDPFSMAVEAQEVDDRRREVEERRREYEEKRKRAKEKADREDAQEDEPPEDG